jgi:hypothetical protein
MSSFLRWILPLGLAACSASPAGGTTVGSPAELDSAPTCAAGTFDLSGVVDSIDRTNSAPVGNYGIANNGNPSTLTVEFGLGGSLVLQWNGTLSIGGTAAATGTLTMPASAGSAPQVYCIGEGSEIERFAWGGKFLLTGMLSAPSADACHAPGMLMPASGELLGCYGYKAP